MKVNKELTKILSGVHLVKIEDIDLVEINNIAKNIFDNKSLNDPRELDTIWDHCLQGVILEVAAAKATGGKVVADCQARG